MKYLKIPIYVLATIFVATPALVFADEPLDEAELFFELNDTDGDLGIHGFADGDEWKELEIEAPNGRELMEIDVKSKLKRQGVTELFFESAEPTFDELSPRRFFRRFPEGYYEIEVELLDGDELESNVWLSHIIPAAPEATADGTSDPQGGCTCDEEDLEDGEICPNIPVITAAAAADGITIAWPAVTQSHKAKWGSDDDTGNADGKIGLGITGDFEVLYYEVVVEIDESIEKSSTIVPATTYSWEVPEDFLEFGDEIKYEVLVRINNKDGNPGNKSAIESCFEVEG